MRFTKKAVSELLAMLPNMTVAELDALRAQIGETKPEFKGWGRMKAEAKRAAIFAFAEGHISGGREPTMPRDKNWTKRQFAAWKAPYVAGHGHKPGEGGASRQAQRAAERRLGKMPLGVTRVAWHRAQGFGGTR